MSFEVYSTDTLPRDKWQSLTKNSIYQSMEFAEIWTSMGGSPHFFIWQEDNIFQTGMCGLLYGKKMLQRFQSMPDGFPGGPCFASNVDTHIKQNFLSGFQDWLKNKRIIRADIHNPIDRFELDSFTHKNSGNHILKINGSGYEPPRKEVRKQIRAAHRREGELLAHFADKHFSQFYKLVLQTEKRHHAKPRYPELLFRKLHEVSSSLDSILWPAVFFNDQMIASRICFVDRGEIFMWQAYSDKEHTRLKAEYLLIDYLINYALEHNISYINFGYSPPEAGMLTFFKERWGAVESKTSNYTSFNWLGKMIYRWR